MIVSLLYFPNKLYCNEAIIMPMTTGLPTTTRDVVHQPTRLPQVTLPIPHQASRVILSAS